MDIGPDTDSAPPIGGPGAGGPAQPLRMEAGGGRRNGPAGAGSARESRQGLRVPSAGAACGCRLPASARDRETALVSASPSEGCVPELGDFYPLHTPTSFN